MPKKPEKWVLDAGKKKPDPKEVLNVVINDCPEIAKKLVEEGLAYEVKE